MSPHNMSHEKFMQRALDIALERMRANMGGPFGAVIVRDGEIVAEGWNEVTSTNDPTAHAEVVAIRRACAKLGTFNLSDCDIYASCEPCPMCLGAIYWARPRRVFFGATARDATAAGFDDAFIYEQISVDPALREIPFVSMMREEALACFREWRAKSDRVEY